jgi:hypothetical protein
MHGLRLRWLAMALCATAACGGTGDSVSCGTGTQLVNGVCIASAAADSPLASVVVSGIGYAGNVMTALEPGHRVPVSLTLTGTARGAASPVTTPVQTAVFLVGTGASPVRCALGGEIVNIPADGRAVGVTPELVIPSACLAAGANSGRFHLEVTLTMGETTNPLTPPPNTQTVLTFSAARASNASLPESRCRMLDGAADARCGLELGIQRPAMPAAGLTFGIELESTVGTLWPRTPPADLRAGATEPPRANLAVDVNLRAYGNDPDRHDDDTLPGPVRISVQLSPDEGDDVGNWETLPFRRHADGSDAPLTHLEYSSLNSGSTDDETLFLYLPDAVQDRMTTGAWQRVGLYRLRVCETTMGWSSEHIATDEDPSLVGATRMDEGDENCRYRTVRFASALGASLSSARTSDWSFRRVSNSNPNLGGVIDLRSRLSLSNTHPGAVAQGQATAVFFGVPLTIFAGGGGAGVSMPEPATSSVGAFLLVLNNQIFNVNERLGTERERAVTRQASLMRESCKSKTFWVKFIPVTVEGCVRGELGVRGEVAVGGGATEIPTQFAGSPAHFYLRATLTPFANVGLGLSAGIGLSVLSAGLYADLTIADFELPVTLHGRIAPPPSGGRVRAFGDISIDIGLTFLKGSFGAYAQVGSSRYERELGSWDGIPGFGSRGSSINVFSRDTPLFSF